MNPTPTGIGWTARGHSSTNLGFTLSETIIVVFLIAMLTSITATTLQNNIEQAKIAGCMIELRGIQAALYYDIDGSEGAIDPDTFWETHYDGTKPGQYVLLVNGTHGSAGNDGPEGGHGTPYFVVVGRQSHWPPGKYVFIEDDMPPQVVTGPDHDPGYGEHIDWEAGREMAAQGAGASGSSSHHSWSSSTSSGASGSGGSMGGGGRPSALAASLGPSSGSSSSSGSGRSTNSTIGE